MKKFTLIILAISLCIAGYADTVTRTQAQKYAQRILGESGTLAIHSSSEILNLPNQESSPSFYLVENPSGGWAIISAEDRTAPILAYSHEGSFDLGNLTQNTRFWLSKVDSNIRNLRKTKGTADAATAKLWKETGTKASGGGRLLETALWAQDSPFNDLCPIVKGSRSPTGCVATAAAIIMRYHKWPEHGTGSLPSYVTEISEMTIPGYSIDSHYYNWDDMPLEYSGTATEQQKKSVAQLMYDCGVMLRMNYVGVFSTAYSRDIVPALSQHMSYSASARELYQSHYSVREWFNMITEEIDRGCPLIYGGTDDVKQEGHQFICDGYDPDGFIHINWGWGGLFNGYYSITYIGDDDKEKIDAAFNSDVSAIFGLKPDRDGKDGAGTELFLLSDEDSGLYGLSLVEGEITKGAPFKIKLGLICNVSYNVPYKGTIKVALLDRNGAVKEYIGEEKEIYVGCAKTSGDVLIPGQIMVDDYECTITGDAVPGDAISVFYRLPDGSWARLGGGGDSDTPTISLLGAFDACFINIPDSYKAGQAYYLDIIPGRKAITKATMYFDNSRCSKGYFEFQPGEHEIKAALEFYDGSKETIIQKIRVN